MERKANDELRKTVKEEIRGIKDSIRDSLIDEDSMLVTIADFNKQVKTLSNVVDTRLMQILNNYETIARRLDRLNDTIIEYFEEEEIGEIEN